jgi:hypothetical protein
MRRGGAGIVLVVALAALVLWGVRSPDDGGGAPEAASTSSEAPPSAAAPAPSPQPDEPAPQQPEAAPAPEAVSNDIAVPEATASGSGSVAELAPVRAPRFSMVGVTWQSGADDGDVEVDVRVRTASGWSGWEPLEVDDHDDEAGRAGTEPWWVADADEVAARVTTTDGRSPADVRVVTVDPGRTTAAPAAKTASPAFHTGPTGPMTTVADGAPAYTPRPAMITRGSWGAKRDNGCDDPPDYPRYGSTTQGIVLHHSAGSNSYSKGQSASIVRAMQKYHMSGRGWCDIGYNFLVDKYGQVFEGRTGGADRQVRGSHAGESTVNEQTMGVSLMGNLDKVKPSAAMKNATVKLVGWRVGTTYMPAKGTVKIGPKTLNIISGHRNVVSTACPGKHGYAWLGEKGGLRDRVAAYVSGYRSDIKTKAASIPVSQKGVAVVGESGSAVQWRRTFFSKIDFYYYKGLGAHTVLGDVKVAYNSLGGRTGSLGFPSTDQKALATPKLGYQRFQNGTVYRVPTDSGTKVRPLWGAIHRSYLAAGDAVGPLGRPTSGIVKTGDRRSRVTFEHGVIDHQWDRDPVVTIDGQPTPTPTTPAPTTPAPTDEPTAPAPTETTPAPEPPVEGSSVAWTSAALPARSGILV